MTWQSAYREHPVWEVASALVELMTQIDGNELTDPGEQSRVLVAEVEKGRTRPHPSVTEQMLTQLAVPIQQMTILVQQENPGIYADSPYHSQWIAQFNTLAELFSRFPISNKQSLDAMSVRIHQARMDLATLADEITGASEEFRTLVETEKSEVAAAWKQALDAAKQSITEAIAELEDQNKLEAENLVNLKAEAEGLADLIQKQEDRMENSLLEYGKEYAAFERERTGEWSDFLSTQTEAADGHKEAMAEHLADSARVLAAVGVNSTATDYGEYAVAQQSIANRWRKGAVAAYLGAALIFVGATLAPMFGYRPDLQWWEVILQKLTAPAGLAGVGYFLSKEAAQHREQERNAKKTQLTITALEPFVARLPEERRNSIRTQTAKAIFADGIATDPEPRDEKTPTESETKSAETQG